MSSAAKPTPDPVRTTRPPQLLARWSSPGQDFVENLRAVLFSTKPLVLTSRPGVYWSDVFVRRPLAWREISLSYVLHALLLTLIYVSPWYSVMLETPRPPESDTRTTITYYKVSQYLPPLRSSSAPAQQPRAGEPAYAPQPIVSLPQMPDNLEQTIVDPTTPKIITRHVDVPNLVVMTHVPAPPIASSPGMPKLALPPELRVVAPAAEPIVRDLSQMKLAQTTAPKMIAPTPDTSDLHAQVSDVNIPKFQPNVEEPKAVLPAIRAVPTQGKEEQAGEVAAPSLPTGAGGQQQSVGQLIALGLNPTLPSGPVSIPGGNRRGEFAAGPEGKPGAPGTPDIKAGGNGRGGEGTNSSGAGPGSGAGDPTGLSIGGSPLAAGSTAVVASAPAPPPSRSPTLSDAQKQILAAAMRPSALPTRDSLPPSGAPNSPGSGKLEDKVFGTKKYYSMTMNLPNLTSAGGSWIVRFAELSENRTAGELTAPVALEKVDPAYPAELVKQRVEGVVTVYAVIHKDGTVGDVRILRGIESRLDENARIALSQWRFQPGTKNGLPVDLEAVVSIPFQVRKLPY